jgi:hypothetical protein
VQQDLSGAPGLRPVAGDLAGVIGSTDTVNTVAETNLQHVPVVVNIPGVGNLTFNENS